MAYLGGVYAQKVHLKMKTMLIGEETACRRSLEKSPRGGVPSITTDPKEVTCRMCRNSVHWKCHLPRDVIGNIQDVEDVPEDVPYDAHIDGLPSPFLEALEAIE